MSTGNKADLPLGFASGIAVCIIGMYIWWHAGIIHRMVMYDLKKNHDIECMRIIHE